MAAQDGPPLLRPIPRRPFGPYSSQDRLAPYDPEPRIQYDPHSQLLSPNFAEGDGLARSQSVLNLTSSTLFGIFGPATPNRDRFDDEPETPWGTGAQTPVRRPDLDDETYKLLTNLLLPVAAATLALPSSTALAWSIGPRVGLLFLLGMGYGALTIMARPQHGWAYLVAWGISGVALGALLPWFDGVWQMTFGPEVAETTAATKEKGGRAGSRTDWSHAVRSIGAFVGIVFALRKLPWVSTLQVSLALALVNPFLWYLVDGTKPGLLLSAAVGFAGSAILIGINPDAMPVPSLAFHPGHAAAAAHNASDNTLNHAASTAGGFASQQTLEAGIWMLSVLFCSCVCFGNIGRRLALSREAAVA
ncbi:unnamed protein product [Parascedosporium putredinis]|uniref:Uncharacterized protein n=1 Tax=Parascedosporium putredinis TaxID=1442378 RepID=A0A9P1GYA5_9PEZI|nr:unnamed protein product [Parascedosporium putredinis]CAI7989759.1 unnamed protein product [Parascedosporium putredinis]